MSSSFAAVEHALHAAEEGQERTSATAVSLPTNFEWFFVITGGAALFLPFLFWMGEAGLTRRDSIHWYFWIGTLISSPHVYATFVRQYRKTREGKVSIWMGPPAYAAAVGLLALGSYLGYYVEVMTAVNVWQSFHYVRQTYGVGCLYGRQAKFDETDRRLRWWAYHLVFPLLIIGRWDLLYDAWGGKTNSLIPVDFGINVMGPLWLVAYAGIYTAIMAETRLIWKNGWKYQPTGAICFLAFLAIHIYGFLILSHFQRGFFAVTIFHALQYLALVWVMERKTALARGNRWIGRIPTLLGFVAFWGALYLLGFGYEQHLTVLANQWWTKASSILLAAISVHHYTVDTFLWRRSAGS